MSTEVLSLPRALNILEIFNPQELAEEELGGIRKRAIRRWHPDKIAHTNPTEEKVQEYETNFRLIEPAIEIIRRFLKGEIHSSDKFSESFMDEPVQDDPLADIPMGKGELQSYLREVINKARRSGHKVKIEKETVHEGFYIRDLLQMDIDDKALVISSVALFSGLTWIQLFIGFPALLLNAPSSGVQSSGLPLFLSNTLLTIGTIASAIHVLSCLAMMLPLSRFWLPDILRPVVGFFVDWVGIRPYNFFLHVMASLDLNLGCIITQLLALGLLMLGLYFRFVQFMATIVNWIIVIPLYKLAQYLVGDRRTHPLQEKVRYFAGVAEWFAEQLLTTPSEELHYDELRVMSHLYAEYQEI